jgi:hypothetical protein
MEERKRSDLDHEFQSKNFPHGHIQVISSAMRGESRSSTVQPVVELQFTAPSGSNPWRFFTFSEQKTSSGNFVSPFQTRTQADARIVEKVVSKPVYATGIVAQGNSTIKTTTCMQIVAAEVLTEIRHASDKRKGYCECCNKFFQQGARLHMKGEYHRASMEYLVSNIYIYIYIYTIYIYIYIYITNSFYIPVVYILRISRTCL